MFLHIIDGEPTDEELAALTSVLLALLRPNRARQTPQPGQGNGRATWRHPVGYRSPTSWR